MTTAAQATRQLAILTAMVGRHEVTNAADLVACDEPAPTTRTPRDPDGLAAENAWERQSRWFEC